MVEYGAKSVSGEKNKEEEREKERGGDSLPTPPRSFPSQISLRGAQNLNPWNRALMHKWWKVISAHNLGKNQSWYF